jgi:hypothetical protein
MSIIWRVGLTAALVLGLPAAALAGQAGNGNGAPEGSHYNLNIIGVSKDRSAELTDSRGHTIFVKPPDPGLPAGRLA